MDKQGVATTGGEQSIHEPSMEALLQLRKALEAELKGNPSSSSDAARKLEALNGQIARRRTA